MKGVIVTDISQNKMDFPAVNIDRSSELTVKLMTGLSQEEIDNLESHEYDMILAEIQKASTLPR